MSSLSVSPETTDQYGSQRPYKVARSGTRDLYIFLYLNNYHRGYKRPASKIGMMLQSSHGSMSNVTPNSDFSYQTDKTYENYSDLYKNLMSLFQESLHV